ncbi:hypothetical protein LXL04_038497 [Taraxacum kok-saghyz]
MRGSQLYIALFFPSLEFFPTGFSLARAMERYLKRKVPIEVTMTKVYRSRENQLKVNDRS